MQQKRKSSGKDYVAKSERTAPIKKAKTEDVSNVQSRNTSPSQGHSWLSSNSMGDVELFPCDRQCYMDIHKTNFTASFYAPPQHIARRVTRKSRYKGVVPYKLEKSNVILFPEWYYLFMKRVSRLTKELEAYCTFSTEIFPFMFEGNAEDVAREVAEVESQFSETFRTNIDSSLSYYHHNKIYTRDFVENEFFIPFKEELDRSPLIARMNQLMEFAKNGKIVPLVDFFEAYGVCESQIWSRLINLCVPSQCSAEHKSKVTEAYEKCSKTIIDSNMLAANPHKSAFRFQIEYFRNRLETEGCFPIPSEQTPPSSSPENKAPDKKRASQAPQKPLVTMYSRKMAFRQWRHENSN
ncbi:hypothetical protein OXX69_000738 [Metschnikowia pulcherrima]